MTKKTGSLAAATLRKTSILAIKVESTIIKQNLLYVPYREDCPRLLGKQLKVIFKNDDDNFTKKEATISHPFRLL